MQPPFPILFEDNHLLIINKPADLPTMGVAADCDSVVTLAKEYLREKFNKPGNVYLGVVSRLDARVTGALLIARTSKAAARLNDAFRTGQVEKIYWAVVPAVPEPASDSCVNWMRKDERHRRMHVCNPQADGAKEARLSYQLLERLGSQALLRVQLETGRKHQIRVQLAHRKLPIVGDRKYGSPLPFDGIALHCRRLALQHPVRKTALEVEAPLPPSWNGFRISSS